MPITQRLVWLMTMGIFLLVTSGCATTNLRKLDEEMARNGTGIHKESGQNIEGYMLVDGTWEEYKGWVRAAGQDSLKFWSQRAIGEPDDDGYQETVREWGPVLARTTVAALDVHSANAAATVLLVVFGGLVAIAVIGLATMDDMEFR